MIGSAHSLRHLQPVPNWRPSNAWAALVEGAHASLGTMYRTASVDLMNHNIHEHFVTSHDKHAAFTAPPKTRKFHSLASVQPECQDSRCD